MSRRARAVESPGAVQQPLIGRDEEDEDLGPALVVCAYDPGETTGWSVWRAPVETLRRQGTRRTLARSKWAIGQIRASQEAVRAGEGDSDMVDRMLEVGRWAYEEFVHVDDEFVFVHEGFRLRMMSMDPNLLAPVRVNAIWRDRLRGKGVPIFQQDPSEAKQIVTDSRLKEWGVYRPGMPHARDAQRHAITFIRKCASTPALLRRVGLLGDSAFS